MSSSRSTWKETEDIPAYFDPLTWHPKCLNFEIIDWKKFESLNPRPPPVYELPQLTWEGWDYRVAGINFFSGRSRFLNFLYPCSVANFLHKCPTSNNPQCHPKTAHVSQDDIFVDLLRPEIASEAVPDALRGVFWMRDNLAPESLVTFQHMAWNSNAVNAGKREKLQNPNGDGVVGVLTFGYNWTYDGTFVGAALRKVAGRKVKGSIQISPSGKWIAMAIGRDFSEEGKVRWCFIYVIQKEDEMKIPDGDEDGPDRHKVKLKPGDLLRIDFDLSNPYNVHSRIHYMYLLRKVASWDAESSTLIKHQPDFDDYRHRATSSNVYKGIRPICGLFACNMKPKERAELVRKELSNRQFYISSPVPPKPQQLDRFGEDTDDAETQNEPPTVVIRREQEKTPLTSRRRPG